LFSMSFIPMEFAPVFLIIDQPLFFTIYRIRSLSREL
jgi:hypothetical protein